jgi:hypothetical protein
MRYLNVNRKETITEEEYYQYALMELGGDTPSWYGLTDVSQGYVYSNIKVIIDGFTKPSESDVNAKITELKKAYTDAQYKRDRAKEYLPLKEQLDMLWHAIDAGKLDKTSDFYTTNKAVKDKYSKG